MRDEVLRSLFDEMDIFHATDHRVTPAKLDRWLKLRRIRTPLLPHAPGNPRLFWIGNLLELEIIDLATARNITPDSLHNPADWMRRVINGTESRRCLVWKFLDAAPELFDVGVFDGKDNNQAMSSIGPAAVLINMDSILINLEAKLTDLIANRDSSQLVRYPDLFDVLEQLEDDPVTKKKVREILSIA